MPNPEMQVQALPALTKRGRKKSPFAIGEEAFKLFEDAGKLLRERKVDEAKSLFPRMQPTDVEYLKRKYGV